MVLGRPVEYQVLIVTHLSYVGDVFDGEHPPKKKVGTHPHDEACESPHRFVLIPLAFGPRPQHAPLEETKIDYVGLCMCICARVCMCVCCFFVSVFLCVCVCLCVCLSVWLFVCLFVRLSICLSVCLFVCMCLFVWLFFFFFFICFVSLCVYLFAS